jgi:two-component system, chemotaxis family, sensor kinase CheA
VVVRGERVPLIRLRRTLQAEQAGTEEAATVAGMGERRAALAVDELVGREQILVKPFEMVKGVLPYFSGATLLADGRPAPVLDSLSVI